MFASEWRDLCDDGLPTPACRCLLPSLTPLVLLWALPLAPSSALSSSLPPSPALPNSGLICYAFIFIVGLNVLHRTSYTVKLT